MTPVAIRSACASGQTVQGVDLIALMCLRVDVPSALLC